MADSMWDSAKAGYKTLAGMRAKGKDLWRDADRESGAPRRGLTSKGFSRAEVRSIRKLAGAKD